MIDGALAVTRDRWRACGRARDAAHSVVALTVTNARRPGGMAPPGRRALSDRRL